MVEINKELKRLIEENALAFATVDENGNPHCIAVGDVKVVSKNKILVGDNYMIKTIKNIKRNNNVTLAVWSRNWEENCIGYELSGTAEYFTSGKWHKMVKEIHKGFPAKGAILITIKKIKKLA
jgi:predicted pyridoxine 5'-phosphate oxidase superfamily flavin-nucleotide-binding protein